MQRVLAIILAALMASMAPALAQTVNSGVVGQDQAGQDQAGQDQQAANSSDGLDAMAQVPPTTNLTPWLIGGLAVGGIVTVIVVASQNNKSTTPTSP